MRHPGGTEPRAGSTASDSLAPLATPDTAGSVVALAARCRNRPAVKFHGVPPAQGDTKAIPIHVPLERRLRFPVRHQADFSEHVRSTVTNGGQAKSNCPIELFRFLAPSGAFGLIAAGGVNPPGLQVVVV